MEDRLKEMVNYMEIDVDLEAECHLELGGGSSRVEKVKDWEDWDCSGIQSVAHYFVSTRFLHCLVGLTTC